MPLSSSPLRSRVRRSMPGGEAFVAEARYGLRLLSWPPLWLSLAGIIVLGALAYQAPRTYTVDVGAPQDQAYTRNFHARLVEGDRTYRWSDVYGYVVFPGLGGSRPFSVTVTLDTERTAPVQLFINGEQFLAEQATPGWRTYSFYVDATHPAALQSRDTVIELRSSEYHSEDNPAEVKGVKVDSVVVAQARAGGFIVPSIATLLYITLSALLAYLLGGRLLQGVSVLNSVRRRALLLGALVGLVLCLILAGDHLGLSTAASHVVVTLASALVILVVVERWVAGWRDSPGRVASRLVGATTAAAFLLRYGGMALPQSVIIDMPYHIKWLTTLLAGQWQALYYPGGLSEVPPEWGMSLLIPKSPLFYVAFAPLRLLPFDLETLVKWLICILDSSLVVCVYWFAKHLSGRTTPGIMASALYASMPLAFRAFAYGILPTIFAQWLAILFFVAVSCARGGGWRLRQWLATTALATLAILAFPTVAVFLSLVVLVLPIGWWYAGRHGPRGSRAALEWQPYAVLIVAWLLSVWLYYGLYISPVLASAQALLAPSSGGGATVKWPGGPLQVLPWTADYVVSLLPALLAVLGVALLINMRLKPGQKRVLWLIAPWLAIWPIFMVANYKIDMIGKHLFFTMAPVAVAGGVGLWAISGRALWGRRLAALLLAAVGWQALVFWVARLVSAST